MSLLTDASLILTPNAYNVGKLYSVIPNTTLGDMDVSRGSSATRVNSGGLIEIARTNLVLYSEQFDNAYWTKVQGGIALAPVVTPNVETAPDGTMTADRVVFNLNGGTLGTDLSSLGSANFTSISITRTQSVYIKTTDGTTKVFTFVSPIGTATTITVTSVYQRFTWTSTGINVSSIRLRLRGSASGEGTATSASIAIWGAQYEDGSVATEYIPTVASIRTKFAGITQDGGFGSNIPRIDYPPLGGCPSILVEPARTNNFLYSEEFDNGYWEIINSTITANATFAPDGTMTADKFIPNTANSTHQIRKIALTSNAYTFSVFAKASGETTFSMWLLGASVRAEFNLSNGTIIINTTTSAKIEPYPNGWYRCSVYSSTPGTTFQIYGRNGSIFEGNNVDGIFFWGAQAEVGAYATSYIPTTIQAITRNADVISRNNIYTNGLLSASGGTWFVELNKNLALTRDGLMTGLFLDTSTDSFTNGFNIRNTGGNSRLTITKWQGGGGGVLYTTTTDTTKIAIKWNGTTADIFANGVKVVIATPFTPTAMQFLKVDSSIGIPYNINQMALWKTALTDDQCILLTGPSFSSYPEMASALIYTLQ